MPAAARKVATTDVENDGSWRVWDKNAILGHRAHQPVPGKTYKLSSDGNGTPMPAEHAAPFLRDPAFVVVNELGQQVASMPAGAIDQTRSEKGGIFLEPGETVAKFAELTQPALMGRAAAIPGGERIEKKTPRGTIIKFLMEHAKQATPTADADSITDPSVEAIDPAGLDQMVQEAGGIEAMK